MRKQVALMAHSREELQVNIYSNMMSVCLSVCLSVWCNMRKQVALMAHSREELLDYTDASLITLYLVVIGIGILNQMNRIFFTYNIH